MKRRNFLGSIAVGSGILVTSPLTAGINNLKPASPGNILSLSREMNADVVIAGGGLGGCATAFAALRNNLRVIMTEETDWIGGQLTQQGVPPDEHHWIESFGATELYRSFREEVRKYYKQHYPLKEEVAAKPLLNPGKAMVSRISHEPKVALEVLERLFAPYESSRQLVILREHIPVAAETDGPRVKSLEVKNLRSGTLYNLKAPYFVDATELGDLLPMTGTEYITGSESKEQTGELHAGEVHDPTNNQAYTVCYAIDYKKGEDWTINRPEQYDFWRNYRPEMKQPWPGKLLELNYSNPRTLKPKDLGFHPEGISMDGILNLWNYRRIIYKDYFKDGFYDGDITIVNYPQNDYFLGNIVDVSKKELDYHVYRGKQLSLSLLYWLQTEAPRPDGGKGWKGLRLRNDVMGTEDGLAKYPYIREARRIKALFTVKEQHVGRKQRAMVAGVSEDVVKAKKFDDSVGIGYYHIDLHPSSGGDNYIDFSSLPFQIPLGSLIPQRMENIFPANKNIGTTHLSNGCYRLHPVEWSIGEAVGMLIPFLMDKKMTAKQVYEDKSVLKNFQEFIRTQGIETEWPEDKMS